MHKKHQGLQAQGELRERLQQLQPQQQQDLAVIVPVLQKGNKVTFKARLAEMVKRGGSERIKLCLQGLAAIGFDAMEIQSWLQKDGLPVPRSKLVPEPQQQQQPQQMPQQQPAPEVKPLAAAVAQQKVEEKRTEPAPQLRASQSVAAPKPQEPVARQPFTNKDAAVVASAMVMPATEPTAATPVAVVGAMAGAAAEQQLAAGKQKKEEEQQKSKAQAQEKAGLRKELAKRLAKGVQALQRVEVVEQSEADFKHQLFADDSRISNLEQALKAEAEERQQEEQENKKLRQELAEEAELSKKTASRLDAMEKLEKAQEEKVSGLAASAAAPKPQEQSAVAETRVAALEEENVKFRAALAGAARRLINLEAEVTSQQQWEAQPQGPKVIRHEKLPLQPAT